VILPFLIFHYGFSQNHCVYDYCTNNRTVSGNFTRIFGKPTLAKNIHTGKPLLVDGKPFLITPVREGEVGIVMRDSIPTIFGWIGGALLPVVLLLAAFKLGLKKRAVKLDITQFP
jgi:hypothetical protein